MYQYMVYLFRSILKLHEDERQSDGLFSCNPLKFKQKRHGSIYGSIYDGWKKTKGRGGVKKPRVQCQKLDLYVCFKILVYTGT